MWLDEVKFDDRGLVPVVAQDVETGRVLMLAWANAQALEETVRTARGVYFSRSRGKLWRKGETSGNVQHIVSIVADCDRDALVVEVIKDGPACHLGTDSCFNNYVYRSDSLAEFSVEGLYELLAGRKRDLPQGSYTTYLFEQGIDKILKKVGEECTEVIVAGKGGDRDETVFEIADLMYHVMVLMVEMGIDTKDVLRELSARHVIDHKIKQQKMK